MSWLKEAEHLTKHKFLTIPLNNGTPTIKYSHRREQLASITELKEWFPDNDNNKKVNGIAISINKTEFAIDTDGEECETILLCGPPASAKSLFMRSLTKLERSYYAVGSSSTKSVLIYIQSFIIIFYSFFISLPKLLGLQISAAP